MPLRSPTSRCGTLGRLKRPVIPAASELRHRRARHRLCVRAPLVFVADTEPLGAGRRGPTANPARHLPFSQASARHVSASATFEAQA